MTAPEERKNPLRSPPLPRVTRLKRNVLLVAGLGVGITIVLVSRFIGSGPEETRESNQQSSRVEASARMELPNFLIRPPQDAPVPPPAYRDSAHAGGTEDNDKAEETGTVEVARASGTLTAMPTANRPRQEPPDSQDEAYQRALQAPLRPDEAQAFGGMPTLPMTGGGPSAIPPSGAPGAYTPTGGGPALGDAFAASPAFVAASTSRETSPRSRHEAFLKGMAEAEEPAAYVPGELVDPISEYQLMAGTVLPAMMVTAMNSDMPGEMLAQISRDVYDSQQRHVLIPRGTKILGRYDSQVSLGQSRALVAWTRLIFPDGRSLSLPGLPTKDLRGASGVESDVDNHYIRVFGQGVLLSLIGAGAQLSQPQQSSVLSTPSAGQVAAGALGRELSQISMETIRRNMDVRPTLEVEAGTPLYIFLARDLVLEGAYVDQRTVARQPSR